jgi:hypothetical protein
MIPAYQAIAATATRNAGPVRAGIAAILLSASLFSSARAALPDEIQVYTDDLEEPGARGVELHINTTPRGNRTQQFPGEVVTHHGLRVTSEISWGIAPGWDWGLYLPFVHSGDGSNYFAGPKLRLKWVPLRPAEGSAGMFAGINIEVAFVQRRFEEARRTMEIRPIIGYRNDDWLISFNPIVDMDLRGEQQRVLVFEPSLKVARNIGGENALGFEYYADFGRLSDFAPTKEQSHNLYLVLDTKRVNFGVGYGFTGASDRWTVKAIVSF